MDKSGEAKYAYNLASQQPDDGPHAGKSLHLQLAHFLLPLNTTMFIKQALQHVCLLPLLLFFCLQSLCFSLLCVFVCFLWLLGWSSPAD